MVILLELGNLKYFENSVDDIFFKANVTAAWRDSTVNYGSWSFDTFLYQETSSLQAISMDFIVEHNNSYNYTGLTDLQFLQNFKAYNILILGGEDLQLFLYRYNGNTSCVWDFSCLFKVLKSSNLGSIPSLDKMYNINVTRNTDGEFRIYFDSQLQFSYTESNSDIENYNIVSQKFRIYSAWGNNSIGNIIVYDIDETPSTISSNSSSISSFQFLVIPVSLSIFFLLKKRAKEKRR